MDLQRVVVVGCCGAGKSIFSKELAQRLGVPYVERDALGELGSEAYRSAVGAVVSTAQWVFDGPPYFVDDLVYSAAQRVLWLDYARPLVVGRAVCRACRRTFAAVEPGENGWWRFQQWVAPGGPRFAWTVYAARKREFGQLALRSDLAGKVVRFATPAAARAWLKTVTDRTSVSGD